MSVGDVLLNSIRQVCGFQYCPVIQPEDWSEVVELAKRHTVLPLLAQGLQGNEDEALAKSMHTILVQSSCRALQVMSWLKVIHEALTAANVRMLVFKGIALKEWAYKGLARHVGDIDILVDPSLYREAQQTLRLLGLVPLKTSACGEYTSAEWRTPDGHVVDLHKALLKPHFFSTPSFEDLWDRRIHMSAHHIATLDPIDHTVFVLLHGLKHQWCRVSWILDVAMMVQGLSASDIAELVARSQKLTASRAVSIGLMLCQEVFNPPGEQWTRALIYDDVLTRLVERRCRKRLFLTVPNTRVEKIKNGIVHALACDVSSDRMRYLRGRIGAF